MAPVLPVSAVPWPGEAIGGYLRRLGRANGFTNLSAIHNALNVAKFIGPESADPSWHSLSLATGLPRSLLERMRWKSVRNEAGGTMSSFLGARVARGFLMPRSLRICPLCIAEDDTLWSFWNVAYVTACPRHNLTLVDRCSCGKLLSSNNWHLDWRCRCGQSFTQLGARPATAAALRNSRILKEFFDFREANLSHASIESEIPKLFKGFQAHDYIVMLHTLGLAATTETEDDQPIDNNSGMYCSVRRENIVSIDKLNIRIDSALEIMGGWPSKIYNLLDKIAYRNRSSVESLPERRAFATRIGRMFLNPMRGASGLPLPILHEAVTAYCAMRFNVRRRKRNPSVRIATVKRIQNQLPLTNIASQIGIPYYVESLGRAYTKTIMTLSENDLGLSDKELADIVSERTIVFYCRASTAVSLNQARKVLEGENGGLRSQNCWHHPKLLMPDQELHGLQRPGVALYPQELLERILSRIDAVAIRISSIHGLMPLCDAIRAGGLHTGYSRTQFLIDMLDGLLPVYTLADRPNLAALFADPAEIRRIAADRRGCPLDGSETYLRPRALNEIIERRLGKSARLSTREFTKLAEEGKIRFDLKFKPREDRANLRKHYRFCTQDVLNNLS